MPIFFNFNLQKLKSDINWVLKNVDSAGIEDILNDNDCFYKVYTLQGINVMTTTDKSLINNLPSGLYIINGKKALIRR